MATTPNSRLSWVTFEKPESSIIAANVSQQIEKTTPLLQYKYGEKLLRWQGVMISRQYLKILAICFFCLSDVAFHTKANSNSFGPTHLISLLCPFCFLYFSILSLLPLQSASRVIKLHLIAKFQSTSFLYHFEAFIETEFEVQTAS